MTTDDEERAPSLLAGLPQTRPQRPSARRAARPPAAAADLMRTAAAPAQARPRATRKVVPEPRAATRPAPSKPSARAAESAPPPAEQPLFATALQAAGELAQVGLAIGAQALRETLGRLKRP